jgi:hypothetical protein
MARRMSAVLKVSDCPKRGNAIMLKESHGWIEPLRDEIPPFLIPFSGIFKQAAGLKNRIVGLISSCIFVHFFQKGGST